MKHTSVGVGVVVLAILAVMSVSFLYLSGLDAGDGDAPALQSVSQVVKEIPEKEEYASPHAKDSALVFLGDMMFDRHIRTVAERKGYDFLLSDSSGLLTASDMVVGNLEGPVTENVSQSVASAIGSRENYIFTFSPSALPFLKTHNMRLVHIGNNHIGNFGAQGIEETKRHLQDREIEYFGAMGGSPDTDSITLHFGGVRVTFISYNEFSSVPIETAMARIREKRSVSDVVVVYAHWGKEYETVSLPEQREKARGFIDAGADAVMGSHPHVVQESEIYKGKSIYYSLGNAFFDQYFSEETRHGLAVEMRINPETHALSFKEYGLVLNPSGQTEVGALLR